VICCGALLVFSLAGCGTLQEMGESSGNKKVAREREERGFDTDAAVQVVKEDWDDVGFRYTEEDISVSNIQQCDDGYLFVMKYLGTGACCNVFYVEKQDGSWKIVDRAEGNVEMTPGISISVAEVNGKKVVWGAVGESVYVKKRDIREEVSFGKLCLTSKNGKECEISIQNNETYLQILQLKNVKSWKVLNTDGREILDQASCRKNYGDDVLEQQK